MIERARRLAPPLLLLIVLAVASVAGFERGLELADPDPSSAAALTSVLDGLPEDALVLVAFDPDLGTYAEVRSTVRSLLADLAARDARLAFVSLTAEGRAIALAELSRLARSGMDETRLADVGFVPGAEAALVVLARAIEGTRSAEGPNGTVDLEGLDMVAVVGGNDIGPRSWVEQVVPRIGDVPVVAVTPAVLLPEVEPYRASGQLAALIATPRQGATYRDSLETVPLAGLGDASGPAPLAVLVGLVIGIGYVGLGAGGRLLGGLRAARGRERA